MDDKKEIFLITTDPQTESEIASVLDEQKSPFVVRVYRDFTTLVHHLEHSPTHLALVDIDQDPTRMLDNLAPLVNRFVHTRFVALCSDLSSNLVLGAMQVGVRHVQAKKAIGSELAIVLQRLAAQGLLREGGRGSVVTFLSAGGGCGTTTLVVNLGNEICLASSQPALLIDFDCHYGGIASYLELEGRYGIGDVMAFSGRVDSQLIDSTALRYSNDLRVLLSPCSVDFHEPKPLRDGKLKEIFAACRESFNFTLIDAPRVSMEMATKLTDESDETYLVLQLTVKDIRLAKSMLAALLRRGVATDQIKLLANRHRKQRQLVGLKEAREALGDVALGHLSNDFTSAIQSFNYGEPLAKTAPRSTLRRELVKLAGQFAEANANHNGDK